MTDWIVSCALNDHPFAFITIVDYVMPKITFISAVQLCYNTSTLSLLMIEKVSDRFVFYQITVSFRWFFIIVKDVWGWCFHKCSHIFSCWHFLHIFYFVTHSITSLQCPTLFHMISHISVFHTCSHVSRLLHIYWYIFTMFHTFKMFTHFQNCKHFSQILFFQILTHFYRFSKCYILLHLFTYVFKFVHTFHIRLQFFTLFHIFRHLHHILKKCSTILVCHTFPAILTHFLHVANFFHNFPYFFICI